MYAFRLTTGGRELACILHQAKGDTGVVICNPFGQEAVRVHRMQRVIADRLSRNGMPVMRFDAYGTGESMGDDGEGDLFGWRQDLVAADRRLRELTGCRRTVWFGQRLGATLAVLAAGEIDQPPVGLVLWEPVTDGAAYLHALDHDHEGAIEFAYGPLRFAAGVPQREPGEAIGFRMGQRLREELLAMSLGGRVLPVASRVIAPPTHPAATWQALPGVAAPRTTAFEHDFDWTAEEALNTALVPAAAVKLVCESIEAFTC